MNASSTGFPVPKTPLSAPGAPTPPAGFTDMFTSRYIDTGEVRLHAVIGGDGPPLLLVHGWPETWYAWRLLMPALARDFTVIAVDQRGMGLSDKPDEGYDNGTLAGDLIALMDALGHERFAVVGHDTGMVISYALAADHSDRVDRLVAVEIPGPPGAVPAPPLFVPGPLNKKLWHIPFNRAGVVAEQLITGREEIFFGYEFEVQGGNPLPSDVVAHYVRGFTSPEALRGGLGFYRDWDLTMTQNAERAKEPLTMPVLAVGGAASWADHVAEGMRATATDVQAVVIAGAGHWVAEQEPEGLLAALTSFLAPYRAQAPTPVDG